MKSQVVLLIGPRSRPKLTYGMSIGFDLLIAGMIKQNIPHVVVDRSLGMGGRKIGVFSRRGVVATLRMLLLFGRRLTHVDTIYITIGSSVAGFLRDMLMIWSSWLLKRRIVLHLHGGGFLDFYESRPALLKRVIASTFSKADVIIVLGRLLCDQFEFIPNVEAKLKIVPNGLPNELQGSLQMHRTRNELNPLRLLYLSNMIPSKGYLDVLEACRILHIERQIPIQCDFCGAFLSTVNDNVETSPSEAETAFYRLIEEKRLEAVVHYHGTVRGERKRTILQNAHVFILPTAYPWEGQPISIIEALAHGLPVIATRYRGIPEQVIDGRNGFLLDQKSPEAIVDAVEKLWRDPSLYEQFSHHAIKHYQQHFTREAHLNRLIPVILGQEAN